MGLTGRNEDPLRIISQTLETRLASVLLSAATASEILDLIGEAGYVIVPRLPTGEMIEAAWADALAEDAGRVWSSMIDAALVLPTTS
jgi:hypothetical protein